MKTAVKWMTAAVAAMTSVALTVFAPVPATLAGTTGADLQVSGSAARPFAGEAFSYTFQVKNSGPEDATSATFTDVLPSGSVYMYATVNLFAAPCSPADTAGGNVVVTCQLGLITKGGQATVIVNVKAPTSAGTFLNTGSTTSAVSDPAPANNSATVSSTVTVATCALPPGEVTMTGLVMLKYTNSVGLFEHFVIQVNGVTYTVITNLYDGTTPLTHVINLDCKQAPVQFVGVGNFVNVTGTLGPPTQFGSFFAPAFNASVVQVLTHKDKV